MTKTQASARRRCAALSPVVLGMTLLLTSGQAALAHPGGHRLEAGDVLPVWTDPSTGERLPGSLLYVRDGVAHVEDVAGRRHTWPMSSLSADDRSRAEAFRARVEMRHGLPGTTPSPAREPDMLWRWLTIALAAVPAWLWLRGLTQARPNRLHLASLLAALPLACGGGATSTTTVSPTPAPSTTGNAASLMAGWFSAFPGHVRTRADSQYIYVESDGLADHTLMVGIRSWQQQVPLPANYTGSNAWRVPLAPTLAASPVSARTGLFRGAIALAVNGIPIFNALNNRGDDAFLFGELDDFGGHSGRADDYHYHTAPLFLSATVGATRPIAVALDGFPLYGALEPDGSAMRTLDAYNGHADGAGSYHYHGTRSYPYINGGMMGVVQVSDQVEPQPSLTPVRPAGTPLAGAQITRHVSTGTSSWSLEYQIAGRTYRVDYRIEGTRVVFVFTDPSGVSRTETYTRT